MAEQQIEVTAEVAASLASGTRTAVILPYSSVNEKLVGSSYLTVLEPFLDGADGFLYAADYPVSYGWRPAGEMSSDRSRMGIRIASVKLRYDQDIGTKDYLRDGLYTQGTWFLWQRLSNNPLKYVTATEAWMVSQVAAWSRRFVPGRLTKSLVCEISVEMARREVA